MAQIPHAVIKLAAEDVPGATLMESDIPKNSVVQLKRYIQCRGLKTKGKTKLELIKLVEQCQKECRSIVESIDHGVWLRAKQKQFRKQDLNQSKLNLVFPIVGWKQFPFHDVPDVFCYGSIYNHLIETAVIVDDEKENYIGFNTAKPLRKGREYFKSGHVKNLEDNLAKDGHFCVRSDVTASMKNQTYRVMVMLEKTSGLIIDATCECKASSMGRCSHVAGLLFAVEDYTVIFGHKAIASTSKLCTWNQGRSEKRSSEIFKQQYNNKRKVDRIMNFQPLHIASSEDELNKNELLFECQYLPNTTMWEMILEFDYMDYNISVERKQVLEICVVQLQESLKFGLTKPGPVSQTEKQHLSQKWISLHSIIITASCCTEFLNLENYDQEKIYKKIRAWMWFPKFFSSIYTQYGHDNEHKALSDYVQKTSNQIMQTGLWVNPKYPGLGATPDGLVFDKNSQSMGILEIKCPYLIKSVDPSSYEKVLNKNQMYNYCLEKRGTDLKLKVCHKYYKQIQMQMAILNVEWCDFVVWSKHGMHIERVYFDNVLWEQMSHSLLNFHKKYISPEYFELRVPRKLLPIKI